MKPNCYECKYRGNVPGDAHSRCKNAKAKIKGDSLGIKKGWFFIHLTLTLHGYWNVMGLNPKLRGGQ